MDDEDRNSILSRRARLIAAALAALTGAATGCDGCSDVVVVDDDDGAGGTPQPCLSPKPEGGGGQGGEGGAGGEGGTPQPCLSQPLGGGGEGGAGGTPQPCLAPR